MKKTLQRKLCSDGQSAPAVDVILVPKTADDLGHWRKLIDEHAEHLRIAGYSARTIERYGYDTRRFCFWLHRRGVAAPMNITPDLCMSFQRAVHYHITAWGNPNPPNSQRSMLTAVRSFTAFLKRKGYVLVDSGHALVFPKCPKRLPREIFTEEEITRVLAMPDVGTLRGYRDRTILEILYATGIRSGELLNLDVRDVNLGGGLMAIREGKGRKDRVVPLGDVAVEFVGGYLRNVRPRFVRSIEESALFVGYNGRRMRQAGQLIKDLRRYLGKAAVTRDAVLHTFRHTCATHMLKGGANIRHIQELLGHKSLETTEQYTRVEIGDLKKVHDAFHPRTRL